MSKAVFLFTFLRVAKPLNLFNIILVVIGFPAFIVYVTNQAGDYSDRFIPLVNSLFGPAITMVIAYLFVSNITGNAKSLHDGEYMALLFSRPLRRSSYIFSKWLAGSLLVFTIVCLQMLLLDFSLRTMGYSIQCTLVDVVNVLLNALGTTALIVLLHAFPPRIGITLFLALVYFSFMTPLLTDTCVGQSSSAAIATQATVNFCCAVLRGFFSFTFDIDPYLNSIKIYWLPALSYISNIVLYLWLAIVVMNKREFFYANE
jgi:hypothetical protein